MAPGCVKDPLHLARLSIEVHGNDAHCFRGDGGFDALWIDVEGGRVDVGKHGRGTGVEDGVGRGHKGERRGDDLVVTVEEFFPLSL